MERRVGGKKIVLYDRTQRFIDPPTPPIEFVHVSHIKYIDIIGHVTTAPGPLDCNSRNAWSPNLS